MTPNVNGVGFVFAENLQINSGMGEDLGLNASEHFSVSSAGAEMLRPLYLAHAILKHIY